MLIVTTIRRKAWKLNSIWDVGVLGWLETGLDSMQQRLFSKI